MKLRKNPTAAQLLRRFRRHPESHHDPRYRNDGYWALRLEGYSHSYARRAFRDQLPKVVERNADSSGSYVDALNSEDILIPPDLVVTTIEVEVRPILTDEAVQSAKARNSEYTIWDERIRGLGLRVRTSGYKSFVFCYRLKGESKLHKATLGTAEYLSLDQAREMAKTIRNEVRELEFDEREP